MNRRGPEYGMPRVRAEIGERDVENIGAKILSILQRGFGSMAILIKSIAGLSITAITDELTVSPVVFLGVGAISVTVTPRPTAKPDTFYAVSVQVNGIERGLDAIKFTQAEIDAATSKTLTFNLLLSDALSIVVEAAIDMQVAILSFEQGGTIGAGLNANVALFADVPEAGIAGFNFVVQIDNPSVARIADIGFPLNFGLTSKNVAADGSSATIQVADIQGMVEGGEKGVSIATINIVGVAPGTANLRLVINLFDDDNGNAIVRRIIKTGSIVVT